MQVKHTIRGGGGLTSKYDGTATVPTRTYYQQLIRSTMSAAITTRPAIAFAVGLLSTHAINPSPVYVKTAERLIVYLRYTKSLSLHY